MRVEVFVTPAYAANKAVRDIDCVSKQLIGKDEFIANPELGVLELRSTGNITEKRTKEFWNEMKKALAPYYDVKIEDDSFTLYDLGTLEPTVLVTQEEAEEIIKEKPAKKPRAKKEKTEEKPTLLNKLFGKKGKADK